jgi:hypothetical protein
MEFRNVCRVGCRAHRETRLDSRWCLVVCRCCLWPVVELRFRSPHQLQRMFVDPTGCHIIISATGSDGAVTLYAHKDKREAKELSKLKVCVDTCGCREVVFICGVVVAPGRPHLFRGLGPGQRRSGHDGLAVAGKFGWSDLRNIHRRSEGKEVCNGAFPPAIAR